MMKTAADFKKAAFLAALLIIGAIVLLLIGFIITKNDQSGEIAGVEAVILEIDMDNQTMRVMGTQRSSVIGDNCIVDWSSADLFTAEPAGSLKELSIESFAVGDHVVLSVGEVLESYPARAKASGIQLQRKKAEDTSGRYSSLWNARTEYAGDNSAVGRLIGLLEIPERVMCVIMQ